MVRKSKALMRARSKWSETLIERRLDRCMLPRYSERSNDIRCREVSNGKVAHKAPHDRKVVIGKQSESLTECQVSPPGWKRFGDRCNENQRDGTC